jgi:RNA polymerase sigma factor (sigma-70 family)
MSALLQASEGASEADPAGDHALVAAVRRGDDRAFEALYQRYHRRIHAYVLGMVKDHQRAEDVTQEVFVSALRRMRATERPIAFKPWVYEIAKNACIDQFRRSKRAEEISFDADEGLAPSDYTRLVSSEPVPDAALAAKQDLDHMVGAFGGLSDAHHQILVLRELEGLSYREIGERMGMSRPAVESTLFRARRRLSQEYDELASGQRCVRVQAIIASAAGGRIGARDTRRLARHVAHCQPCRRQALAAGVDEALVARRPARRRAIEKVAGLFPIPLLLRARRDGSSDWASQLPVVSDHAATGGGKLIALAAVLVAGLGAGVGTQVAHRSDRPADRPARAIERSAAPQVAAPVSATIAGSRSASEQRDPAGKRTSDRAARGERDRVSSTGKRRGASAPAAGGGSRTPASPQQALEDAAKLPPTPSEPSAPKAEPPKLPLPEVKLPQVTLPAGGGGGGTPSLPQVDVSPTVDSVNNAVEGVTGTVQGAVDGASDAVQGTVDGTTGAVENATGIKLP